MFKFKTFILTIITIILLSSNLYADTFFPIYIKPGNSFTNTLDLDYINEYTTGNGIYIQNVRIWGHANASGGSFIVGDNSYLTILPGTTNYSYYIGDDIIPSTNDYNNLLGGQAAGQNWSVTKTYGANNGLGYRVFYNLRYGFNNSGIGHRAGEAIVDGVNNICLGSLAGPTADSSNQLFIDIAKTDTPLIHGNFSTDIVTINGELRSTVDPTTAAGIGDRGYNDARYTLLTTQAEINDSWIEQILPPIVFLNFSSGDATDFGYYGNDFTAGNTPAYGNDNAVYYADIEFDSSQYFSKANGAWDDGLTSGIAIIALIKLESGTGAVQYIASKYHYDGGTPANSELEYSFYKDASEYLTFIIFDNSVCQAGTLTYIGRRTGTAMSLDTYYLVVAEYVPSAGTSADIGVTWIKLSDMTIDEDTTNVEANAGSFVAIEDADIETVIGGYSGPTSVYDGIIGDVLISSSTITPNTIHSIANAIRTRLGL